MSSTTGLRDRIEREADLQDVELETIRVIDSESDGTTFRILAEDGETEAEQVGFQVTKPPGPLGEEMFTNQLDDGMRQLKRLLNGEDPNPEPEPDPEPEPTDSDTTTSTDPTGREVETERSAPEMGVALTVSMDDDSLTELRNELSDVLEDYDERTVAETRVAELEEQLEELDARIEKLEETLSMLGNVGK